MNQSSFISSKKSGLLLLVLIIAACSLKSKEELYMERGLDILSNKKQVNFQLKEGVTIEEIGVIRDKKERKKVLVFKMHPTIHTDSLTGKMISLRARIVEKNKSVRIEHWDFEPVLMEIGGHKYLTTDIHLEEDKIQKLYVYIYRFGDDKKRNQGPVLTVPNLGTYND